MGHKDSYTGRNPGFGSRAPVNRGGGGVSKRLIVSRVTSEKDRTLRMLIERGRHEIEMRQFLNNDANHRLDLITVATLLFARSAAALFRRE